MNASHAPATNAAAAAGDISRRAGRLARLRRGSVLLFVLVLVVVTSAAILKFSERALAEMAGEGYHVQRGRLRGEAYSALEATLAVLALYREVDGGLYAPAQGWGDPLVFAGYEPAPGREVHVEFSDENGKLPLANAELSEPALAALFADLGFEAGEVEVLTDSLIDWIDADDNTRPFGAEKEDYLRTDPAHAAANATPRSFAELAAVQGFADLMFTESGRPTPRFEEFTRRVSLWSDGTINLNTIPDATLRASGLLDTAQLDVLGRALDTVDGERGTAGANYYRSMGELAAKVGTLPSNGQFGVQTRELGIVITVRERQAEFRLRAVVRADTTGSRRRGANGARQQSPNSAVKTGNADSSSPEYPFRFLELVEDPPPSSIAELQPTP
ncbi:MAG: type II secretion system protein GspK [Opitutaceae bacterium]